MDEVMFAEFPTEMPKLFNSQLEVGLRAIVILDAFSPRRLDLTEISLFDYFVVHTSDVGGPSSLHPDIVSRTGEYLIRRRLIEDGIKLMHRVHLVEIRNEDTGIKFEASDEAGVLLDLMSTPYNEKLKLCARWLAEQADGLTSGEFEERLRKTIDRWALQFDADSASIGGMI